MIITIDGYSWLGKSYYGKKIANELNFEFLSTGILVRMVAMELIETLRIYSEEKKAVEEALLRVSEIKDINVCNDFLYSERVEMKLKTLSKYSFVNDGLKSVLVKYVNNRDIVLDGRYTFEIFPNAYRRYYFESSCENRAMLVSTIKKISITEAKKYILFRDSFEQKLEIPDNICIIDPFLFKEDILIKHIIGDIQ